MKFKKLIDRGLSKKGDLRSVYKVRADGMEFWTLIPPAQDEGEVLLKDKAFKISELKEGMNNGEYFSKDDIKAIRLEKRRGA